MATDRPSHMLATPRWTLAIHAIQVVLAIIILGLDAYGISYIAFNALVYSLVACLCTFAVCAYMIVSQLFAHKLYNIHAFIGLHAWMTIFWLADFSSVANLARIFGTVSCIYDSIFEYCTFGKRDLVKRNTTYGAYWGALVAGSVFGALMFVLWGISFFIHMMYFNRHRANAHSIPPPQYTGPSTNDQAVPMEKYNNTNTTTTTVPAPQNFQSAPQQAFQPAPQAQYTQPTHQGFAQQPTSGGTPSEFPTPYNQHQDPINREASVTPISVAGGYASPSTTHAELATAHHTENNMYRPELGEHK